MSGLFLPRQGKASSAKAGNLNLTNPGLANVCEALQNAVKTLKGTQETKIVLIMDQLDLLLAAGGDGIGAVGVGETLMSLREVYACALEIVAHRMLNQHFRAYIPPYCPFQPTYLLCQVSRHLWRWIMLLSC